MAEISCGGHVESAALEGDWRPWCDDCHYAVRARLAEVEAERDAALAGSREIRGTLLAAAARLAEVEGDRTAEVVHSRRCCGAWETETHRDFCGEGDRPAEVDRTMQYIAERDAELLRRLGEGPT